MREVVNIVRKFIPKADIELEARRTFPWPPSYDCTKAQEELGYKPCFNIECGVKDFIGEVEKKRK